MIYSLKLLGWLNFYWLGWLLAFLGMEAWALAVNARATLSETVWSLEGLNTGQPFDLSLWSDTHWAIALTIWLLFLWLSLHLPFGLLRLGDQLKVVPQASNCKEIEVAGRVYRRSRSGLFDMPESAARYTIAHEGGQLPALSGTTRTGIGFRCVECGFGSFFGDCSRCGGVCFREG